ncbi:unnamed protein product [Prorocentrum cordatum]|uniref:Uncharacterized protein n=1 Tax=Prorocentrum cordatum TaxID=2364126 RepID=A0ABN9SZR4_9DINO|nr:unnamed protein product [Polarella glacialis]
MFELDDELSEYINHMWLNGDSHGYAADTVSAMARFCPGARAAIPTTRQYLRNCDKVLVRKRAFPVFKELARAMVGAALAYDRADLAALVLHVIIQDTATVETLRSASAGVGSQQPVYSKVPSRFSLENKWLAGSFGAQGDTVTPRGLRRGGATWLRLLTGSLDRVAVAGRRQEARTARIYIETAAAEMGKWRHGPKAAELMRSAGLAQGAQPPLAATAAAKDTRDREGGNRKRERVRGTQRS